MAAKKEDVYNALKHVEEPDLKKDLVTLNMIRDVEVSENSVSFTVILTTPACPLKEVLKNNCTEAIHKHIDKNLEVNIEMVAETTSGRSAGSDQPLLPNVKNIIAVASGKGGVGKSTVTANLAVSLANEGAKVGLIDADIYGPSIPTMFGVENQRPKMIKREDKSYIVPLEQYGVQLISIGILVNPEDAVVWRGPMASSALKQFFTDVEWDDLDYLLIDLPPGTSDIHLTLVQTVPVTGSIIVTTPQKVAISDAIKALNMFRQKQINVPVLGIVENMAYFVPEEFPDYQYYIFGKEGGKQLAEQYNVPLLGEIPLVQSIRENGDEGRPAILHHDVTADSFAGLSKEFARQVAIRNASLDETKKVDIVV